MRRGWRAPFVVLACLGGAVGIVVSCTTFDGLTVPPAQEDASTDAVMDMRVGETGETSTGPAGYLSVLDAARLCSLVFQCPYLATSIIDSLAIPADPTDYSLCMHWLAGPIPPNRVGLTLQAQALTCMASATTCTGAGSCLWDENLAPNDPRCADSGPADGGDYCGDDGGTVYRCSSGYLLHCDSAFYSAGSRCLTGADGTHWCALDTNCTVQDSCLGTLNDFCGLPSNLHFGQNCAYDGYTCGLASNDDSGLAGCFTGGMNEPCGSPGTSCSGTTLLVCDGFAKSPFDCAALGGTCSTQGGAAVCVHSGDTCTPFDNGLDQCSGSSISLCIGGHGLTFDCASVGKTCVPASGSTSGHCG